AFELLEKLFHKSWHIRPSMSGYEISFGMERFFDISGSGGIDFRFAGDIAGHFSTFDMFTNRCYHKTGMANGSDRFIGFEKVADDLRYALIKTDVLRRAPARNDQSIIFFWIHIGKCRISFNHVSFFLGIRFPADKVMDDGL